MAFQSGKGGKITYNSVDLPVIDHEENVENNLANTTNALSTTDPANANAASATCISGPVTTITGTANILWDSAAKPDSIGLSAGLSAAATVVLGTAAVGYVGTLFVKDVRLRTNTREGALQYALSYQFSGAVSRP